jgi:hypothetical protein
VTELRILKLLGLLLIALLAPVGFGQAPPFPLWIGFRYDESRVISYVARMEDPVTIKQSELKPLQNPVTPYSWCGYQIALTAERLKTFKLLTGTIPRIGQSLTVIPEGNTIMAASVEGYIEDWRGDSEVAVGILAEVFPAERRRFENSNSGYFLISTEKKPAPPPLIQDPTSGVEYKTKVVRSHFGSLGDLIERTAEAGREFRLFRTVGGSLKPTAVETSCSD